MDYQMISSPEALVTVRTLVRTLSSMTPQVHFQWATWKALLPTEVTIKDLSCAMHYLVITKWALYLASMKDRITWVSLSPFYDISDQLRSRSAHCNQDTHRVHQLHWAPSDCGQFSRGCASPSGSWSSWHNVNRWKAGCLGHERPCDISGSPISGTPYCKCHTCEAFHLYAALCDSLGLTDHWKLFHRLYTKRVFPQCVSACAASSRSDSWKFCCTFDMCDCLSCFPQHLVWPLNFQKQFLRPTNDTIIIWLINWKDYGITSVQKSVFPCCCSERAWSANRTDGSQKYLRIRISFYKTFPFEKHYKIIAPMLSKTLSVWEPLSTIATIKLSSFGALQMWPAGNLQLESASIQAACAVQFHHLIFAQ